jgi:integrase
VLSPRDWRQLERDLLVRQDLAPTTTAKTLATLRRIAQDGFPLARPTLEAYQELVARRKRAGARGTALKHDYRAVARLLAWRRIRWPADAFTPPRVETPDVELVDDQVVAQLTRGGALVRDQVERALATFAFNLLFYIGARPPSEHVALRLSDFDRATGKLYVWSDKVERGRTLQLEPWLAQIVTNYIDGPRAELKPRTSALLVNARGRAWTAEAYRMWLSRVGKGSCSWFYPYAGRHWCLTYRLIQWDFRLLPVQRWAGHKTARTTECYLHVAQSKLDARALAHQVSPLALT